jgi:hypothetical protein
MQSLIYVSRSSLPPDDRSRILGDILAASIERNTAMDISGILITTPDFFAQVLEGPKSGVDMVMTSIGKDSRHHQVRELWCSEQSARRYPHWRMARFDAAHFGQIHLDPILLACHDGNDPRANARLRRILDLISYNLSYLSAPALADAQSNGLIL